MNPNKTRRLPSPKESAKGRGPKKAEYFIQRGDDTRGPTTAARIRASAAAGKVSKDDLIRRGENGAWFRAGDIPGLFDQPAGEVSDEELLQDPLVALAQNATGLIKRAAGAVGRTTLQLGSSVKGAMARQTEHVPAPAKDAELQSAPIQTVRIPAAEVPILIDPQSLEEMTQCPFCAETIKKSAKKCKHCGEILDVVLRHVQESSAGKAVAAAQPAINITNVNTANAGYGYGPAWSPLVAALLSLIIPGLGQMYKGQILNGIVWFFLVPVGYVALIVPGLVLHIFCVLGAAMGDPYRR